MTLVIAAQGKDFVVLGTDSRATMTDSIGNRMEINFMVKLISITDYVGILVHGAAEEAMYLVDSFQQKIKNQKDGVMQIAKKFEKFCKDEAKKTKDVPIGQLPIFGFIIAGLEKSGKSKFIPRCYTLKSYNGFSLGFDPHGFAINGKPMIANYFFAKNYRKNMLVDDLSRLVAQAFHDTMHIDGDVGGKIHMAIIDSSGLRNITDADIDTLIEKWVSF